EHLGAGLFRRDEIAKRSECPDVHLVGAQRLDDGAVARARLVQLDVDVKPVSEIFLQVIEAEGLGLWLFDAGGERVSKNLRTLGGRAFGVTRVARTHRQ